MTAPEVEPGLPAATPLPPGPPKSDFHAHLLKRLLIFGTDLGIAVGAKNLEAVIVRSRASGPSVMAAATIHDFRSRAAAEWGSELLRFLAGAHEKQLSATVILPRDEVIVRMLNVPGVADKEVPGAIELQIDTLHPFGEEEVAWAWSRTSASSVMVAVVRRVVLTGYETLFSEAGIGLSGITFSASAIHGALRIWSSPPFSLLLHFPGLQNGGERERTELYGESPSRPLYSAEFSLPLERALAVARGELRLDPDYHTHALLEMLPKSRRAHADYSPLAYAAAVAASAPLFTGFANLLPPDRRASSARRQYVLPVILGVLLAVAAVAALVILPAIERRDYLNGLNAEIRRLEPAAQRAQALDRSIKANRAKIAALDEFRLRPQADLDVLNELTRILPPQVWTNTIEIYPDNVVLSGEADQAAPLVKLLDSSPLFQNSDFALSMSRNPATQTEQFRIKTMRRNRTGRTTP
ncbi:MAG: PilN domain-containing protein [Terriglobia bacterium]